MSREFVISDYVGLDEALDMGTDLIDQTLAEVIDTKADGFMTEVRGQTIANLKAARYRLERLQGEIDGRHHG